MVLSVAVDVAEVELSERLFGKDMVGKFAFGDLLRNFCSFCWFAIVEDNFFSSFVVVEFFPAKTRGDLLVTFVVIANALIGCFVMVINGFSCGLFGSFCFAAIFDCSFVPFMLLPGFVLSEASGDFLVTLDVIAVMFVGSFFVEIIVVGFGSGGLFSNFCSFCFSSNFIRLIN